MEPDQQLRNLRDFLLVYNRMTEICFQRCTSNLNYRNLTMDEERCVDSCAGKLIRSNHRLMGTYVQLMPGIVQRRLAEMEAKAGEASKASLLAPAADAGAVMPTAPGATGAVSLALGQSTDGTKEAPPVLDTATPPVLDTATPPVLDTATPPVLDTATPPVLDTATPPRLDTATPPRLAEADVEVMPVMQSAVTGRPDNDQE